jgi:hypothetical protein
LRRGDPAQEFLRRGVLIPPWETFCLPDINERHEYIRQWAREISIHAYCDVDGTQQRPS